MDGKNAVGDGNGDTDRNIVITASSCAHEGNRNICVYFNLA